MSGELRSRPAARMRALYARTNRYKIPGKGETFPPEIDPDNLANELAGLRRQSALWGLGRAATGREIVLVECLRGTVCNRVNMPFYVNRRNVNQIADIVEKDAMDIAEAAVMTADELLEKRAVQARRASRGRIFVPVSRAEMTGLVLASEIYRGDTSSGGSTGLVEEGDGPIIGPGERFERIHNIAAMLRLAAEARLDEAERDRLLPNLMLLALAQQGFNFSLRQWSHNLEKRDVNISPLVLKNVMNILGSEEGLDRDMADGLLALTRPVYPNSQGEMVPGKHLEFIRRGIGRHKLQERGAGVEEGSHYPLLCLMANTAFDLMTGLSDASREELLTAKLSILSATEEYEDTRLQLMVHSIPYIDPETIRERKRRLPRLPLMAARKIFGQRLAAKRSENQ